MRAQCLLSLGVVFACLGCGPVGESNRAQEESGLKPLAIFYAEFVPQHEGKPPKNEYEFKAFLKEPQNLERLNKQFHFPDIDSIFISARDHKPYVVIYGPTSGEGPAGQPVVAYEQDGVEGKRFVASKLGAVEEVDEDKFRRMVPNPP